MKNRSPRWAKMKVSADGTGVASHAGCELLRELAAASGLVGAWDRALISAYSGLPSHFPGQVLADLAVSIADGATSIMGLKVLRDQPGLFGQVASEPTAWRVLDKVSEDRLPALRAGRAKARAAAWGAGAAPDLSGELVLDFDATVVVAHSEKEGAAPTWKHTFGFHPLYCFLDRPEVSSGEALAGLLRPGNAGSNTAEDHIAVLDMAMESLPSYARPGQDGAPRLLARADSAGATFAFAAACRQRGVGFSFGFPIDQGVRLAISLVPEDIWEPAVEADGEERDGAYLAELTRMLDLSPWPEGSRVIVRRERPHPGAALTLFEVGRGVALHGFHHRHSQGRRPRRHSRLGAAPPPPCPCRRPHPPVKSRWAEELPLRRGCREQGLDGSRPCRRRPRVLVKAHMLCRQAAHCPLRGRGLPLRHIAHGCSGHPVWSNSPPALGPCLGVGRCAGAGVLPPPRRLHLRATLSPGLHQTRRVVSRA